MISGVFMMSDLSRHIYEQCNIVRVSLLWWKWWKW